MYTQQWIFNAPREPSRGISKIQKFSGKDHLVVLRHGHVFKVMLRDGGENVSYEKLRATFQDIMNKPLENDSWVGILATDDRDSWAKTREAMKTGGSRHFAIDYFYGL
jgi:hypothetical protein